MEFKENNYEKIVELFRSFGETEENYCIFYADDYPIPYKDLTIYPVQVDLYLFFNALVECLLVPHLTSGDVNAISKTYFDYLIYLSKEKNEKQYLHMLIELLQICLKLPLKDEKGNLNFDIIQDDKKYLLRIKNNTYDSKDFDKIRKIILEQNGLELPDEKTNPEILQAAKEAEALKKKMSKIKMCDLEDQINIIVATTSYKRDECLNMTIRSFNRLFERIDKIMHYKLYTLLSPNLKDEAKSKIEFYAEARKNNKERLLEMKQDAETVEKNFTTGKNI